MTWRNSTQQICWVQLWFFYCSKYRRARSFVQGRPVRPVVKCCSESVEAVGNQTKMFPRIGGIFGGMEESANIKNPYVSRVRTMNAIPAAPCRTGCQCKRRAHVLSDSPLSAAGVFRASARPI